MDKRNQALGFLCVDEVLECLLIVLIDPVEVIGNMLIVEAG